MNKRTCLLTSVLIAIVLPLLASCSGTARADKDWEQDFESGKEDMIHQYILANPRPGMSVEDFQDYWISVHARDYASKIPQIKRYKVNRILGEDSSYHGLAEIWLENEAEQLASLQSPEFVEGARADEPNWAAFWQSICLDTYSYKHLASEDAPQMKLVIICKRKEGVSLDSFRSDAFYKISPLFADVPGISQCVQSVVKDGHYQFGESLSDMIWQLWFDNPDALRAAVDGPEFKKAMDELIKIGNQDYIHQYICEENVIIP